MYKQIRETMIVEQKLLRKILTDEIAEKKRNEEQPQSQTDKPEVISSEESPADDATPASATSTSAQTPTGNTIESVLVKNEPVEQQQQQSQSQLDTSQSSSPSKSSTSSSSSSSSSSPKSFIRKRQRELNVLNKKTLNQRLIDLKNAIRKATPPFTLQDHLFEFLENKATKLGKKK